MIDGKARDYFKDGWRLIKERLRLIVGTFLALTIVVAIGLKYFISRSDWFYCIGSAAMLTIGLSMFVLSSAIAVRRGNSGRH